MTLLRIRVSEIVLCGLVVMAMGSSTARAAVVFGNLGSAGTDAIGGTSTDYGPSDPNELAIAQGFTVGGGSTLLDLQSIQLGLFVDNSVSAPRTVSIFSNNAGAPGTSLFTSAPVSVLNGAYTFSFSSATLTAGSSYWVVPSGPASWYLNQALTAPTVQNGSGYSALGTLVQNTSSQWVSSPFSQYSVSVVAVPEPMTLGLLGVVGLAGGITATRRRRR